MIDYKKIKKYPAIKNGKQVKSGDSIPISNLTEKTDTINNFEFLALDDTNLNQSLKLNLATHSKQVGEANKVIDSDDIVVSEEISSDLGKTQKLSIVKPSRSKFLRKVFDVSVEGNTLTLTQPEIDSVDTIEIDLQGDYRSFTDVNLSIPNSSTIKLIISYVTANVSSSSLPIPFYIKFGTAIKITFLLVNDASSVSNQTSVLYEPVNQFFSSKIFSVDVINGSLFNPKGIFGTCILDRISGSLVTDVKGCKLLQTSSFDSNFIYKIGVAYIDTAQPKVSLSYFKSSNVAKVEIKLGGNICFIGRPSGIVDIRATQSFIYIKKTLGSSQYLPYKTDINTLLTYNLNSTFVTTSDTFTFGTSSVNSNTFWLVCLYYDGQAGF